MKSYCTLLIFAGCMLASCSELSDKKQEIIEAATSDGGNSSLREYFPELGDSLDDGTVYQAPEASGDYIRTSPTPRKFSDFPHIVNEINADLLIDRIARTNCVEAMHIGLGGAYSEQYARYERLMQLLNDEQVFDLLHHPNATVRMYAYDGLVLRNSNYVKRAKQVLSNDTATIWTFSGCLKMNSTVKYQVELDSVIQRRRDSLMQRHGQYVWKDRLLR